ncbi:hypothetical protein EDD18DRAFT_1109229 [Armillaria luteobubalina]|uniref:Uncharacterized protein n=1 Tax=Armillaria luteobubalina TaxID=153913 RepID=A0AA39PX05_9AGAR|nr:hypothetical protein EDD18DRAFT_1109229 [Armillaria luteobubalina]
MLVTPPLINTSLIPQVPLKPTEETIVVDTCVSPRSPCQSRNMSSNQNSSEPPPMGCLLYYQWEGRRYLIDYKVFKFTSQQGEYLDDQAEKYPEKDIVKNFLDFFLEEEEAALGDPMVMQVCEQAMIHWLQLTMISRHPGTPFSQEWIQRTARN